LGNASDLLMLMAEIVENSPAEAHVSLHDLRVHRGDRDLVRGLNVVVPRGSFVCVVGPSGAGKTSLLSCLAGMTEPGSGTITYRCLEKCDHAPAGFQKRLGLVFQHLRLSQNASVLTNVLSGLLGDLPWWKTLFGFSRKDKVRARALLADFELESYARVPVARLSGGEKQRTAICRALIQNPEVLLADEPISNLDTRLSRDVLKRFKAETRENHRTVFCVLHDPDLVAEFADYTLRLDKLCPDAWKLDRRPA
jgi:phosphonate transport system ATP-binding protein